MNEAIAQLTEERVQLAGMSVTDVKFAMANHPLWDVEFLKKDGSVRKMIATRDWKFLEENADEMQYTKPTHPANYDCEAAGMIRVWDCNELDWRTIPTGDRLMRLDRID
jgi:hypothetical protein